MHKKRNNICFLYKRGGHNPDERQGFARALEIRETKNVCVLRYLKVLKHAC
jgi:hypothetical protein